MRSVRNRKWVESRFLIRPHFLKDSVLSENVRPNDDRVAALSRVPMPTDIKRLCNLLTGFRCYRDLLPIIVRPIRLMATLLKRAMRSNSPPQWRTMFAPFSRNFSTADSRRLRLGRGHQQLPTPPPLRRRWRYWLRSHSCLIRHGSIDYIV